MAKRNFSLFSSPLDNKGTTFSHEERSALGIRGFFPAGTPLTLEQKVRLHMEVLQSKSSPLEKYIYLHTIQDMDETLFFSMLCNHTYQIMPLVYTPTVGEACQKWHKIFKQSPRGVYLSTNDLGHCEEILRSYRATDVKVIVVTDGERILGLGDLGANGMGIPVGKLALYTACAGIDPACCLPVSIDNGTNTKSLQEDEFYLGLKHPRIRDERYDNLVDEFIQSCKRVYGENVLIQFEDFGNENAFRLLDKYINNTCCFNDDIQGTASVVLAGLISGLKLCNKASLAEHTFLFYGAGEAGVGIANLICEAIIHTSSLTLEQARARIWLIDSKGLIYRERDDFASHKMAHHKLPYAHPINAEMRAILDKYGKLSTQDEILLSSIDAVKPSGLIGVSAQGQTFTKPVIELMCAINPKPLIFALSNPTSKSECSATDAYTFSNGTAVFASGSPFEPVTLPDGRYYVPGQGNNCYIFPGVGLGVVVAGAKTVTEYGDFYVAAKALASLVTEERLAVGCLYPRLEDIREVSACIAAEVAEAMFESGRATVPRPADILAACKAAMYQANYKM